MRELTQRDGQLKKVFFQQATDAAAAHRDLSHYTSLTLLTIAGLRIE